MNKETTVKVLNEWMRRYIDEPERFEAEVTTLKEFLSDEAAGKEPSYGECCGPYMFQIAEELGLIEVKK